MSEKATTQIIRKAEPPIRGWWAWLATLFSGLLLALVHPPVGFGPLVFLAFVPWIVALPGFRTTRGALVCSFFSGLIAYSIPFMFLKDMVGYAGTESAMYGLWAASALICSTTHAFFAVAGRYVTRRLSRRWWALCLPLLWMGFEELRYHFPVPSPLMLPGYALSQIDLLIQIADIGAVHLVSGFILFVATTMAIALDGKLRKESDGKIFAPVAMTIAFLAVGGYGMFRMAAVEDQVERTGGPRLAIVQPNIPQEVKNSSDHKTRWNTHQRMTFEDARPENPDLIVWSETAYPWLVPAPENKPSGPFEIGVAELAAVIQTPILTGATTKPSTEDLERYPYLEETEKKQATYNSALLYDTQGKRIAQYDKAHLVPGGEYIPYRDNVVGEFAMSYANALMEGFATTLIPGHRRGIMRLNDKRGNEWRFSANVCYEFGFPELAVEVHNNDALPEDERNVHFVATLSNEAWYQGGAELDQALIYSRFRAIESRATVVRATNDGISAVIDPLGIVVQKLENENGSDRQISGVLHAELPYIAKPEPTIYLQIGNAPYRALKWLSLLLVFWVAIDSIFLKRKDRKEARKGVDGVTMIGNEKSTEKLKKALAESERKTQVAKADSDSEKPSKDES